MGYQPRGKAFDPDKLIPPPSGTGVTMPPIHQITREPIRLCADCIKRDKLVCPFVDVHPHALACAEFSTSLFTIRLDARAQGKAQRLREMMEMVEAKLVRIPKPTHMPSPGMRVLK